MTGTHKKHTTMKTFLKITLLAAAAVTVSACENMIDPPPFIRETLPPSPPPGPIKPVEALANPERGYHLEYAYYAHKTLLDNGSVADPETEALFSIPELVGRWGYDGSSRLIQLYVYLKQWSGSDLPQSALDNIQKAFDIVRAGGFKVILRFAYNDDMYVNNRLDKPETIRRHLEQLKPLLEANTGLVATMQAGFLGAWGEWHSSPLTDNDQQIKDDVVNGLLEIFPAPRGVQVRELARKDALALRNTSDYPRIGIHSDFFTAGMDPIDKMSMPGEEYNRMKEQSPHFYMTGEIPYVEDEYGFVQIMDISKVMVILRDQHFSAFDITQNYELNIQNWKVQKVYPALLDANNMLYDETYFQQGENVVNRSFYEFVRDHLGYRINAKSVGISVSGGSIRCDITLTNTGFAAPLNPRKVFLVLIGTDGTIASATELTDVDPLGWQPYDPASGNYTPLQHTVSASVPAAGLSGSYKVGIWMPDPLNEGRGGDYDLLWAPGPLVEHWTDAGEMRRVNIVGTVEI